MASITADAVHLRASGVSLVVAVGDRRLPRVVHWGADLGDLAPAALSAFAASSGGPDQGDGTAERHAVAVLPEHSWGWLGTPGLSGHRDGRDHSTRFTASAVDLASEGAGERAVQRLSVRAADAVADLGVTVVIEMLASGLVRARATVESTGPGSGGDASSPYCLDALTIALPVPAGAREIGAIAGAPGVSRTPFSPGTHASESRRGTPGAGGTALIAVGTAGFGFRAGEVWLTHVAWSGNTRHIAERGDDGAAILGGGELLFPGEVRLGLAGDDADGGGNADGGAAAGSYASPWVYFSYGAGLDGASARIHRSLRSRATHPTKPRPVVVATTGLARDLAALTEIADAAADVGAELFVLGDGWFKGRSAEGAGLGDWYVDKSVFPEGMRPFADYVRGLGLEFGLWFEPEMISQDSDLARQHPEWIAQASLAGASLRLPLEQRSQQVLDLTNPGAYAHVEERLHALVGELRPTHLVWDHRRDLIEAGSPSSGRAIGHEQTLAFYRLLDGLRAAFPGLEIEVRSSGGGRADLGALGRAERVRASASDGPLDLRCPAGTTSLIVPPELTGADVGTRPGGSGGAAHAARLTGALWAHLGFEWNVEEGAPPVGERDILRTWIELHKRYRKLVHTGEVVRSDAQGSDLVVRGVVSRDRREALFAFEATGATAVDAPKLLRLEGLDPARAYRVTRVRTSGDGDGLGPVTSGWWDQGVTVAGRMLAAHGIQAPPPSPGGMTLIRVERG